MYCNNFDSGFFLGEIPYIKKYSPIPIDAYRDSGITGWLTFR